MTPADSPLPVLTEQARKIACALKDAERGDISVPARARETVTFGVAMDDKILTITMPWATIRETTEAGLVEYIIRKMQGAPDATN